MTDSFILGLSSGSACLLTCGMVMFPYLLSGAAGTRKIVIDLSAFLMTRLVVYFILTTAAWYFGQAVFANQFSANIIPGILYITFSVMLVRYSIGSGRKQDCPARSIAGVSDHRLIPLFLGVVNSIGFCPALFILLTKGAAQSSLVKSWSDLLAFFAGSLIWFLPLPAFGKFRKTKLLSTIGILATGLAGVIFMIKGLTNLIQGLING
jgi:hypothetical protein